MDIRTKLVFALVAVSLGSMLAIGAVAYSTAGDLLRDNTLRQLDALAETKKEDLEKVILGWRDRVNLIASRTQLRLSLLAYEQAHSPEQRDRIRRIIADAKRSVQTVQLLVVYDASNHPVASTATEGVDELEDLDTSRLPRGEEHISFEDISFGAEDRLRVSFVAPLLLEGERIGALHAVMSAGELLDLAENFTGLGESGETLIALEDEAGMVMILHPVRHRLVDQPGTHYPERAEDPVIRALQGEEGVFAEGLIDYRGQPVWAATRYLTEVGWGMVVKFDAAEARAPIQELWRRLTRTALSLSAFAILLGIVLGLRFAKPIHDLAEVANRIRLGDLHARASSSSEDEIGLLARTFNHMAEELERRMEASQDRPDRPGSGESDTGDSAQT